VCEADDTSPSSDEVKMNGAISPLHLRLRGVDRDNINLIHLCIYVYIKQYVLSIYGYIKLNAIRMKSESCS